MKRLIADNIIGLEFKPYEFRGFVAKRNVASFGYIYNYKMRTIEKAAAMPPFILELKKKVAEFAGKPPIAASASVSY